ncbi:hypothetical protein [Pseudorhodoplanes sp.]|uniref:hypothetical protein n=1 Tax=Pseudorhodoplanes sp. TaxID=1934341 RepID=UPI002BD60BC1|nr:hypothetical protein [Pseudorhodoplanes sp.]HWV55570.1 hypothetical protein [Pseudorhodoplanes sp.]
MNDVSPALMMQKELLPGEKLLSSFGANVLLPLHPDAGRTGAPPYVLGASAPRKVLGMLHLTNYRLKFKPANPVEPAFSIMLPAISAIRNASFLFVRKFRLVMQDGTHIDFLKWGIPAVIAAINAVATQTRQLDWAAIERDIAAAPETMGAWSIQLSDVQPTTSVASAG